MVVSIQDLDSVGKVREIFRFWAVFRDSASDCTKLTLALSQQANKQFNKTQNSNHQSKINSETSSQRSQGRSAPPYRMRCHSRGRFRRTGLRSGARGVCASA